MSDLYYDWGFSKEKVASGDSFAACCGSRYRKSRDATPERKWKNQYGEGITPAKPARKVDMEYGNTRGILLTLGRQKEVNNDKITSKQIKTKNGWITVSTRSRF